MKISFFAPKYRYSGYGASVLKLKKFLAKKGYFLDENCSYHEVGLVYHLPQYLDQIESRIKILFTMIESDRIPKAWIPYMRRADIIVTPSLFCQRVFERQLGRKVEVVPLGVDPDDFNFIDRAKRAKPLTFLQYDSFSKRKGWWELFNGWQLAFGNSNDYKLICKTAEMGFVPPLINYPNIKPIRKRYGISEMRKLLADADFFVFPSWGEGFGLTPLEAMATGIPAIVTTGSGIGTYFNKDYMLDLEMKRIPAIYDYIAERPLGYFHPATKESIAKRLKEMADNYDYWYSKGREISDWVLKNWGYDKTADKLSEVIEKAQRRAHMVNYEVSAIVPRLQNISIIKNPFAKEVDQSLASEGDLNKKKIAMTITSGLGNNIMAIPAIKSVREQYPEAKIDLFTWERASDLWSFVIKEIGVDAIYVDSVPEKAQYNYCLEFLVDGRFRDVLSCGETLEIVKTDFGTKHEVEVNNDLVRKIGAKPKSEYPKITELSNIGSNHYIVHVGYSHTEDYWVHKNWGAKNYSELFRRIKNEFGLLPLIVGTKEDEADIKEIEYEDKVVLLSLPLAELADKMRRAKFFIGNDSGVMHLASLVGIPTFGIFTFTSPIKNRPIGKRSYYISPDVGCAPCMRLVGETPCEGEKVCIKDLTVDKVFKWFSDTYKKL